jgi:cyclase
MLKKRIIACLDIKEGKVVKGIQFKGHHIIGDIVELAKRYSDKGIDELVLYDIAASPANQLVDYQWVERIAREINIPFCVAGGIRSVDSAKRLFQFGCEKISVNSFALDRPEVIEELVQLFGRQAIVVGIDTKFVKDDYYVHQFTGCSKSQKSLKLKAKDWIKQIERLGAGEIVLNCMDSDGMKNGYDIKQIQTLIENCHIPVIASGGAGCIDDFIEVFRQTKVSGALGASVFHQKMIDVGLLKQRLSQSDIGVRPYE